MVRQLPFAGAACALLLAACVSTPVVRDGDLAVPPDYTSWPKFLSAVQRPDAKQVREIYMNPVAAKATAAGGFPNGSLFVMENYAAAETPDGKLATGPDGKLVKGPLLRVFVMGKNPGWGQDVPEAQRNGNWVYAGWMADGRTRSPEATATCRACHLPLAAKDFVHRYDEYFASRR